MKSLLTAILCLVFLAWGGSGCERKGPEAQVRAVAKESKSNGSNSMVDQIVFIDLEEACQCTRRRIEASWSALQTVLGPDPAVPVKRIHLDAQPKQAEPYQAERAFMVPPAIYFLDNAGNILEMLQGEVSAKQMEEALVRRYFNRSEGETQPSSR